MRFARLVLALSLVSAFVADDAFAAKKEKGSDTAAAAEQPKIEMTGIAEFDSVFSKAAAIQTTLDDSYGQLKTGREKVNTTLGIATDAPLKTALADLNTKAGNKISVAMEGSRPSLKASDAVPENVQAGIDAANELFAAAEKSAATAKELVPETQALISACAAFPGQVTNVVKDPMAAAKALKTVNTNIKAIKATPERVELLAAEVEGLWNDVKATFPG